ncbi:DUF3780 domain-containing protein [Deinococcus budaensis]|uniref:DUF3780 domain-containing protein n=1 Tax=Deinococcus budaensis TaxID=1665626 RepID=A0A7W8GCB8_9DEIO|nr:DUF3780 domain-containing protein [Deinococcus budaensis]MBB5232975.1 hypothetical protein [Deinococcus budaensis]
MTKKSAMSTPGHFNAPSSERPHMLVAVPTSKKELVNFYEVRENVEGRLARVLRAQLSHQQWSAIARTAEFTFNEHLRDAGERPGRFLKTGDTRLSLNNLGKELLVLVWAVEDATEDEVDVIRVSWQRLHRIERWWLFNQTVALNGDPRGRGKGWRAALKLMLAATATGPGTEVGDLTTTLQLMPTRKTRTKSGKNDMEPMFRRKSA